MKRVYVAGPYNGSDICICLDHMRQGIQAAVKVLRTGYAPFCAWTDYHYRLISPKITRQMYLEQSLAWLEKADCVLAIPGWAGSKGAVIEVEFAQKKRIPVYFSIKELIKKERR